MHEKLRYSYQAGKQLAVCAERYLAWRTARRGTGSLIVAIRGTMALAVMLAVAATISHAAIVWLLVFLA